MYYWLSFPTFLLYFFFKSTDMVNMPQFFMEHLWNLWKWEYNDLYEKMNIFDLQQLHYGIWWSFSYPCLVWKSRSRSLLFFVSHELFQLLVLLLVICDCLLVFKQHKITLYTLMFCLIPGYWRLDQGIRVWPKLSWYITWKG